MKAHDLAKALLAAPNVPVVINGWGSDEGVTFEVTEVSKLGTCAYSGARDTKRTPRNATARRRKAQELKARPLGRDRHLHSHFRDPLRPGYSGQRHPGARPRLVKLRFDRNRMQDAEHFNT